MTTQTVKVTEHGLDEFSNFPWDRLLPEWGRYFRGKLERKEFGEASTDEEPKTCHYVRFYTNGVYVAEDWAIPEDVMHVLKYIYLKGGTDRAADIRHFLGIST